MAPRKKSSSRVLTKERKRLAKLVQARGLRTTRITSSGQRKLMTASQLRAKLGKQRKRRNQIRLPELLELSRKFDFGITKDMIPACGIQEQVDFDIMGGDPDDLMVCLPKTGRPSTCPKKVWDRLMQLWEADDIFTCE